MAPTRVYTAPVRLSMSAKTPVAADPLRQPVIVFWPAALACPAGAAPVVAPVWPVVIPPWLAPVCEELPVVPWVARGEVVCDEAADPVCPGVEED